MSTLMQNARLLLFVESFNDLTRLISDGRLAQESLREFLFKSAGFLDSSKGLLCVVLGSSVHFESFGFTKEENILLKSLLNENPLLGKDELFSDSKHVLYEYIVQEEAIIVLGYADKERREGIVPFTDLDELFVQTLIRQLGFIVDSERIMMELDTQIDRTNAILESSPSGIMALDKNKKVIFSNKKAADILNFPPERLRGVYIPDALSVSASLRRFLERLDLSHLPAAAENLNVSASSNKVLRARVNGYKFKRSAFLPAEDAFLLVIDDVTQFSRVKESFRRYLSDELLERSLSDNNKLRLGGEEIDCAIFFSDIRGFTAMSEKMSASQVVETLNQYYNVMIGFIENNGGAVDKIVGDEIMAVFRGDDVKAINQSAVNAGLSMFEALKVFNMMRKEASEVEISIGIGIHFGKAIAGNIGSFDRMDNTVIGDNVNLASRMCSTAERGQIVITQSVYDNIGEATDKFYKSDAVAVKGKSDPIQIYRCQA